MKMNVIKRFEEVVAANGLPGIIRLTKYDSFSDWHLPAEDGPATEEDFHAAQHATDQLAEHATRRGVKVVAVRFHLKQYNAWRGAREDTRNLRAQWAGEIERKVDLTFVVGHDSIGWAVIEK